MTKSLYWPEEFSGCEEERAIRVTTIANYFSSHLALDGRRLSVLGLADLVHELLVKAKMSETSAGLRRSGAGHLPIKKKKNNHKKTKTTHINKIKTANHIPHNVERKREERRIVHNRARFSNVKSTNPQVEFVSQLHHLCSSQAVELFMLIVEVLLERRVVDLPGGHKTILFISLIHDTTTNNESLYDV